LSVLPAARREKKFFADDGHIIGSFDSDLHPLAFYGQDDYTNTSV